MMEGEGASPRTREGLRRRYREVRRFTEHLCEPLETEDYVVQAMPDASPTKWHLAHVSWFFETFLLKSRAPGYRELNPAFATLFNSYYVQAGDRFQRDRRGLLTRPTVREVLDYRAHVDAGIERLLDEADEDEISEAAGVITLGLHHEQQHQELILTDLKYLLSANPLRPCYRKAREAVVGPRAALRWVEFAGGVREIGFSGDGFHFDNETPRHLEWVSPFALSNRLVTNGEYREFMAAGGYTTPELWLSDGWATASREGWQAPLYWETRGGESFTLAGQRPIDPDEPVCHVSYYEADAYARWRGCRLPTEVEWETAAAGAPESGNFVESARFHPAPAGLDGGGLLQLRGDVWEWTGSAYLPYPGFRPLPGALGEYNGKFMCNQFVLRGGSCATSASHFRTTYRNFFYPHCRWQFMGIRLARDTSR